MTSDVTAVWANNRRENLQHTIMREDQRRIRIQGDSEKCLELIHEYENDLDELSVDIAAGFKSAKLKIEADDLFRSITNDLQIYRENVSRNATSLVRINDRLVDLKFKLKAIPTSDITLKQSELRRQLKSDPRISEVRLVKDFASGLFEQLSFRVDNMIARVNNVTSLTGNYDQYLQGEHWHKLPPLRVHIYPDNIRFRPIRGHGREYYDSSSLSCHPHILHGARGEPCLGDFGGPLTEALDNGDMMSAVSIALLFLEQIDNHDGAGNSWTRANAYLPRSYVKPGYRYVLGRYRYTMPDGETYWALFYSEELADIDISVGTIQDLLKDYVVRYSSDILLWLRRRPDDSHFAHANIVEFEFKNTGIGLQDIQRDSDLLPFIPNCSFPPTFDEDGYAYGLWHLDRTPDPQSIDDLYLALQD